MFPHTKSVLLLLFAVATTTRSAIFVPYSASKISPEIINELKDFLDLIPTSTVDEIVAKHYIIDSNFREVFNYVRSTQFTKLLQQAQQIPEVVAILDYLHLLVPAAANAAAAAQLHATYGTVNTSTSDVLLQIEPQLNFVLLNELGNGVAVVQPEESEVDAVKLNRFAPTPSTPLHVPHLRTFNSFVEELLGHLPRDQYAQLINQKRQQNLAFAQFYAALRSAELRPMVDVTLKSSNLTAIIKTLSSNGVDVKSLEATAFKVISWGPVPLALP
ncbi:uncharacterized protein LOC128865898 [Anastrepha ludens]|uniref:uncharacterized protein LOC128865898 n=1 Tax=Anastrepha ludens TaxID=28586 RepID=UPI0023B0F80E|nr:uncharacterized protein LOC128865898 [Anastrepha ludens]